MGKVMRVIEVTEIHYSSHRYFTTQESRTSFPMFRVLSKHLLYRISFPAHLHGWPLYRHRISHQDAPVLGCLHLSYC